MENRLAEDLGDGVADLDKDHADLMSLANQFARLREGNHLHRAQSVLRELLCSAEAHWNREVDMLRRYGYPGTDDHALQHLSVQEGLSELLTERHDADATTCEDIVVRMMIDDHRWKWWFLDSGIRPMVRT